jgi:transposase
MRTQRIDAALKRKAIILYLEGFSSREVEQLTGVHYVSLLKWVKEFGPKFRLLLSNEEANRVILKKPTAKIKVPENSWLLLTGSGDSILYTHPGTTTAPS